MSDFRQTFVEPSSKICQTFVDYVKFVSKRQQLLSKRGTQELPCNYGDVHLTPGLCRHFEHCLMNCGGLANPFPGCITRFVLEGRGSVAFKHVLLPLREVTDPVDTKN